ncbi:MAG TPA: hypothetical protein VIS72_18665 [Anaerolineales bacterium]
MRPNPRPSQIPHGQPGKALELYEQIPLIHREVGCAGEATTRFNLAMLLRD